MGWRGFSSRCQSMKVLSSQQRLQVPGTEHWMLHLSLVGSVHEPKKDNMCCSKKKRQQQTWPQKSQKHIQKLQLKIHIVKNTHTHTRRPKNNLNLNKHSACDGPATTISESSSNKPSAAGKAVGFKSALLKGKIQR